MRCEGSRCTLDDTKSKQAETCFDRLIALHPNYAEAQVGKCDLLASHYSGAGFWPSFLECYDTALALKPDLVEAWIGKGVVFYKMGTDISLFRHDRGSLAEAVRCFDRVLALKPDHADARHWKDKALFAMERQ